MKRLMIAAGLLLGGALGAHADENVWVDIAKHARGDDAVRADASYCEQKVGRDLDGRPTSRQFKRCMLGRGWRFDHTKHEPVEHTWIDPDTRLTCKDIKAFGGVIGSYCSNM